MQILCSLQSAVSQGYNTHNTVKTNTNTYWTKTQVSVTLKLSRFYYFALQHNWTASVQLHQFLGCIGMAWHSSAVIFGSSTGRQTAACFRVVMSWGDHWPLRWSIRIFCAVPQPVPWTSVNVCWCNWLSHVYDICTFPGCGCLVCYKTCNKQILGIPLRILSIYFLHEKIINYSFRYIQLSKF